MDSSKLPFGELTKRRGRILGRTIIDIVGGDVVMAGTKAITTNKFVYHNTVFAVRTSHNPKSRSTRITQGIDPSYLIWLTADGLKYQIYGVCIPYVLQRHGKPAQPGEVLTVSPCDGDLLGDFHMSTAELDLQVQQHQFGGFDMATLDVDLNVISRETIESIAVWLHNAVMFDREELIDDEVFDPTTDL